MGVISPYKTFTFDGESSADYGVYLTGEGVFNAPERSVEMVEIPGRNGNFALDKGKFENIEVTYRVGMFDDDEENFADKVSAFRNWLCSKVGYVRLSDDYNPNEYRMAVYMSGVELEHDFLIAGEAEITFNCKPQRWLTSGETAVSVADGGTLDNPTLFESEPLLAVKGYGNIAFNGYDITIENVVLGDVLIWNASESTASQRSTVTVEKTMGKYGSFMTGDTFTVNGKQVVATVGKMANKNVTACTINSTTNCTASYKITSGNLDVTINVPSVTFAIGTASSATNSVVDFTLTLDGSTYNRTVTVKTQWVNSSRKLRHVTEWSTLGTLIQDTTTKLPTVYGYSTKSVLGNPTYIDCDIGECYMYDSDDNIVTLNSAIDLGSDLPKLVSGTNTINYDNTITDFKVTPRWWKV